jgi:hypothetical protein
VSRTVSRYGCFTPPWTGWFDDCGCVDGRWVDGVTRRRQVLAAATATAVVAAGVFVFTYFQPHKLFFDEVVDDAVPEGAVIADTGPVATFDTSPAESETPAGTATPPVESTVEAAAPMSFIALAHPTTGTALLLEVPGTGERYVRFEGFSTDNGPDLKVYLSTSPADGPEAAFDDDFVDLGRLHGNRGNQNYAVPAGTDLDRYASVVIWCDRFDVAFGAASLMSGS